MKFIDERRHRWGVEPICAVLTGKDMPIAPATYYAAKKRAPSARAVRDGELKQLIMGVYEAASGVYRIRKIHAQVVRQGTLVARHRRAAVLSAGRPRRGAGQVPAEDQACPRGWASR